MSQSNLSARHAGGLATPLRIGTRGSPLALWQARRFMAVLAGFCPALAGPDGLAEQPIRTSGDASQAAGTRLADIGGKGLFAKEIHEALLDRRIDCAVHSLKDLETQLPAGIVLACTLAREDARDALILGPGLAPPDPAAPFAALPHGAVIGTSSLRRQAQLAHARPDLEIRTLRGNVASRLDKLAAGACAATLLAVAGLRRLGMGDVGLPLEPSVMVPAAGQGIIGVTVRADDAVLRALLTGIEDAEAYAVATAERALLAELDGSCRTPIGGHARLLADGTLLLTGLVARADGSFLLRRELSGPAGAAAAIGRELGASLRADSPRDILG